MSLESFNPSPENNYDTMSFSDLEQDPMAGPILQQKALEVLKTDDKEWFDSEYTGELDERGYLVKKNETGASTMPSMNISGGKVMEKVLELTRAELKKAS